MGDRYAGRIEAFSDGVFSIAATLLVLEMSCRLPTFDDLWRGIADQWPSYLSYATSFLTIGGIWLVHHSMVRHLRFADSAVIDSASAERAVRVRGERSPARSRR